MFATTLTTDRLTLRPLRMEDAEAIFERYASDPEVTRYMSWVTNTEVEQTREFIRAVTAEDEAARQCVWAICIGDDPLPSGTIGLVKRGARVEFGYALRRSAWGQGYATEATKALIAEALRHLEIWRAQAYCHIEHAASARVLEKCGLQREGVARRMHILPQISPEPQDCLTYAITRDDL